MKTPDEITIRLKVNLLQSIGGVILGTTIGLAIAVTIFIASAKIEHHRWEQAQQEARAVELHGQVQSSIQTLLTYTRQHPGENEEEVFRQARWIADYNQAVFGAAIKSFTNEYQQAFQRLLQKEPTKLKEC